MSPTRRRTIMISITLLATVFIAACPRSDRTSPVYSSSGWYESEVSGIRVLTNARRDLARRSLRKLARFLVLASAAGNQSLPDQQITLHLFARGSQYRGYYGNQNTAGHALGTGDGYYIALANDQPGSTTHTLFHEIVHLLAYNEQRFVPTWYLEGYAEFMGSAILRPGVATLGSFVPSRVEALKNHKMMGLAKMFSIRSTHTLSPAEAKLFYAEAWGFVHYIFVSSQSETLEPQLHEFLDFIAAGEPIDISFLAAFGKSIERVERSYKVHREFLSKGEGLLYRHYVYADIEEAIQFHRIDDSVVDRDLAQHAMGLQRIAVAFHHYSRLSRNTKDRPDGLLGQATVLAMARKFDDADDAADKIDHDLPQWFEARGNVEFGHYVSLDTERYEQASSTESTTTLTETASPNPTERDARLAASHVYYLSGIEANPGCTACWLGIATFHARHPDGHATVGRTALEKAGANYQNGTLDAELLLRLHRFEEAVAVIERVIASSHHPILTEYAIRLKALILKEQRASRDRDVVEAA